MTAERLLPKDECWCGCDKPTSIGALFLAGHEKVAESASILVRHGGVLGFLKHHGFAPNGLNAR
jgi:hypothetical protein